MSSRSRRRSGSKSPKRHSGSPLINLLELPRDVQILIIEELPLKNIKNLCVSSRYFAELCRTKIVQKIIEKKERQPQVYIYPTFKPYNFQEKNIIKRTENSFLAPLGIVIYKKKLYKKEDEGIPYNGEKYLLISRSEPNGPYIKKKQVHGIKYYHLSDNIDEYKYNQRTGLYMKGGDVAISL